MGACAIFTCATSGRPSDLHDFLKGGLELGHFLLSADRDSNPGGHDGPDASNHDVLVGHGIAHFLAGALYIDHEAVGLGRDIGESVAGEKLERLLAEGSFDAAAIGNPGGLSKSGPCRD